jgi:hypothetical protein
MYLQAVPVEGGELNRAVERVGRVTTFVLLVSLVVAWSISTQPSRKGTLCTAGAAGLVNIVSYKRNDPRISMIPARSRWKHRRGLSPDRIFMCGMFLDIRIESHVILHGEQGDDSCYALAVDASGLRLKPKASLK